jgi:subtilisin family serine protease
MNCSQAGFFSALRAIARKVSLLLAVVVAASLSFLPRVLADDVTAGPNGINSRGLGLSGAGVNIGQVELGRPGESVPILPDANGEWFWDHGADQLPGTFDAGEGNGVRNFPEWFVDHDGNGAYTAGFVNAHPDVEPWDTSVIANFAPQRAPILMSPPPAPDPMASFITRATYLNNFATTADSQVDRHALQVAGVMIANGATNKGVSTGTHLYSGAFGLRGSTDNDVIRTTQAVLRSVLAGQISDVRAVNHSWGSGPLPANGNDGSDPSSLAMDYFSSRYDSLQVIAGDEEQMPPSHPGAPSDAFNVLNVSMLTDASLMGTGVYDRYDNINRFVPSPGFRDTVHLAAPGRAVLMPLLGGNTYATNNGTSFAAPHVTATTALLQQHGNAQAGPRWDGSKRVHQVMKAVLLNSADKLKDDGTIVPKGNLLGMEKTIYTDPAGTQTWLNSGAYTDLNDPLDDNIGAGALNANRALKQYSPGEFDSDVTSNGQIPLIGWDNAFSLGTGGVHNYFFNTSLLANSFVSITLSWDRIVNLVDNVGANGLFDAGDSFSTPLNPLADLDLFLFKKNSITGLFTDLVTRSTSGVDSTEHIFYRLTNAGDYSIRVSHLGGNIGSAEFGLAWWAVPEPGTISLMVLGIVLAVPRRARR